MTSMCWAGYLIVISITKGVGISAPYSLTIIYSGYLGIVIGDYWSLAPPTRMSSQRNPAGIANPEAVSWFTITKQNHDFISSR